MRTGVTPDQIEVAAHRMLGDPPPVRWDQDRINRYLAIAREELSHYGLWLVPDANRIIALDDLKRLRSEFVRICEGGFCAWEAGPSYDLDETIARIDTIIAAPDGEQETT